jgi:hypothetical protein
VGKPDLTKLYKAALTALLSRGDKAVIASDGTVRLWHVGDTILDVRDPPRKKPPVQVLLAILESLAPTRWESLVRWVVSRA